MSSSVEYQASIGFEMVGLELDVGGPNADDGKDLFLPSTDCFL